MGNSPSASQEHIVTETFIPAYKSSKELYAETEELFTISSVPASRGYIGFLQRERLEALLTPKSANAEELNVSYLFKELAEAKGSSGLFAPPLAVSLSRLCDGRVSLKDAMASAEQSSKSSFSWNSDWDLALFTLDSFQPSWLQLGKVILNDFSLWMLSRTRLESLRPTLLIIDEASALTRDGTPPVLPALLQRARSAQVSLVLASQTYTAFGESMNEIINSGAIRWLGSSSKVEEMVSATGTTSITESGHQQVDGRYSGVISHREQKQFLIDPDLVRSLPTFHWLVSQQQKVSHLFVPPRKE